MNGARYAHIAHGFERVDAVKPHPVRIFAVGVEVGERRRFCARIPLFAIGGAGMTAHTNVQINHKAEFFLWHSFRKRCHYFSPLILLPWPSLRPLMFRE